MIVYSYHPVTGAFTGPIEADESPLEPGVFIIPAHATEIAPPATAEGEIAVFDGAAWAVQAKPVPVDENILAAPSTLFGGPSIKECFSGQQ